MKQSLKLIGIGIVSGIILAVLLQLVYVVTGNEAYMLLYNVDYFPFIHVFQDDFWFGLAFHFMFCIVSIVGLFYLLTIFGWQYDIWLYAAIYTFGSGVLYFLTLLTDQPPAGDDGLAWFYWTASHLVFSLAVGWMVRRFVDFETSKHIS